MPVIRFDAPSRTWGVGYVSQDGKFSSFADFKTAIGAAHLIHLMHGGILSFEEFGGRMEPENLL